MATHNGLSAGAQARVVKKGPLFGLCPPGWPTLTLSVLALRSDIYRTCRSQPTPEIRFVQQSPRDSAGSRSTCTTSTRSVSATRRVPQHTTRLSHSRWGQCRDVASKHRPRERVKVVEVHDTIARNTVGNSSKLQFGNQMPFRAQE